MPGGLPQHHYTYHLHSRANMINKSSNFSVLLLFKVQIGYNSPTRGVNFTIAHGPALANPCKKPLLRGYQLMGPKKSRL